METRSPSAATVKPGNPVLQPETAVRTELPSGAKKSIQKLARSQAALRKSTGYGLPCAQCHLYYPADLDHCPTCESEDRVSPNVSQAMSRTQGAEDAPEVLEVEPEKVEKEREEFLKQFKSQRYIAQEEASNSPAVCSLAERHVDLPETATICKPCYARLQERVDVFEAALHIDLKEAAQIVYDAVWADPSEPSKTYTNAANALMTELRKRSGVSILLGPFHSMGN